MYAPSNWHVYDYVTDTPINKSNNSKFCMVHFMTELIPLYQLLVTH